MNSNAFKDPLISVDEAKKALNSKNAVFIDTRDPEAFKAGHIPGAVNIHEIFNYLGESNKEGIEEMTKFFENLVRKSGIKGDEDLIVYEACLNTRFGVSCRGYFILSTIGLKNVHVLDGGWEAWNQKNLETEIEVKEYPKSNFKAEWNDSLYANKTEVLEILKKEKQATLVDVREDAEWTGASSSPYGVDFVPRKGRLEGAVHLMWGDLMRKEESGLTHLKTSEEVNKICEQKGINKEKPVVVYCFKGARASNTLIALKRAGFNDVKNYFASWNEWSKDFSLPIDERRL